MKEKKTRESAKSGINKDGTQLAQVMKRILEKRDLLQPNVAPNE